MTTLLEQLIRTPARATELIRALDPQNANHRRAALDALEGLVDGYIIPAAPLLTVPEPDDVDSVSRFDLSEIAGVEVMDLVAGLLADDFPDLRSPPPDVELKPKLDYYGIHIPTPERRAAYFRAWTAGRALSGVVHLLKVLDGGHPAGGADDQREIDVLRRLAAAPIPGLWQGVIESQAARRARAASPLI